jgi:hypothetical protein
LLIFYLIQVNKSANQYMHYMMCPIFNNRKTLEAITMMLKKTLTAAFIAGIASLPMQSAQAWWGGGPGWGDGWGSDWGPFDGDGFGDFNMSMSGGGRGHGYGRGYGYGYGYPYYGGWGGPYGGWGGPYGGWGGPYGYGGYPGYYGAPAAPAAPATGEAK